MCEGKVIQRAVDNTAEKAQGRKEEEHARLISAGYREIKGAPTPLPLAPPPFTLKDIREAIPKHCFQRSLLTSFKHLLQDFAIVSSLFYAATFIDSLPLPPIARFFLWPVYWVVQGIFMTGIWVLAHECGHQAFSDYKIVNDAVGLVCHSLLLVPYHNWRISHRRHHSNTGSCENDEVFVPPSRSSLRDEMLQESPIINALQIVFMLTVGWMPGYLVFNATGPTKYKGKNANHFSPDCVMFSPKERMDIVVSNVGFFLFLSFLTWFAATYSFSTLFFYYLAPYMVVNHNLVLITFLQHTDTYIPHFRGDEWNWLRGALCTVDRKFGLFFDWACHRITDTHVCHHIFSTMPFYHAEEATKHMKKVLGEYYLYDSTPVHRALWRAYTNCKFVEDNDSVVFYKKNLKE